MVVLNEDWRLVRKITLMRPIWEQRIGRVARRVLGMEQQIVDPTPSQRHAA